VRQGAKGRQTDRESGSHGRHKTEKQEAKRRRDGETRRQTDWETRAKGDRTPGEQDTGSLGRQETRGPADRETGCHREPKRTEHREAPGDRCQRRQWRHRDWEPKEK